MTRDVAVVCALIDNAGTDVRRIVQRAVLMVTQSGSHEEVLQALRTRTELAARWIRAALTEKVSGIDAAKPLWEEVVEQNGCEIPEVLLHRARLLVRSGDIKAAAMLLRIALENSRDYDLYLRAEAIAQKCRGGFETNRTIRIALLGSSTTSLLRSVLQLQLLRDCIDAEFYEAPFGTYVQEFLQPGSALRCFHPDFIVLLLNWRDLGLSSISPDRTELDNAIGRIKGLWKGLEDLPSGKIIQPTFSPPDFDAMHELSTLLRFGRSRAIRDINSALYATVESRVILIDSERIAARCNGPWEDQFIWSSAKIYPTPAILPSLGAHIVSCIRAEMGLSRKLLILDADNTLWGGVVGEDGLNGIRLGPPSALGERYYEFQRYLKDLRERGILLALVSKNNPKDVAEVLRDHPSSVLKPEDFVSSKVNWENKPANIRQIALELRLGLDSFVFMDDNPSERSAVRRAIPELIVPEISGEPAESIAALERGLYFQALNLSSEDRARSASYSVNIHLAVSTGSFSSMQDYLAELSMQVGCGFIDIETSTRVTQLVNKTNQFNLTTPRYTQEEIQSRISSPAYWCRWYRLKDRFADHGLIGILIAHLSDKYWSVDTWLMSCRVIGRDVESYMFRDLVLSAREAGVQRIIARYIPTPKNGLVAQLLPGFGFAQAEEAGSFALDVSDAILPDCRFLREVKIV